MQWFKNLKTLTKLMLAFAAMSLLILFVGYQGTSSASTINDLLNKLYGREMLGLSNIQDASINILRIERDTRGAIISSDPAEVQQLSQSVDDNFKALDGDIAETEPRVSSEQARAQLAQIKELRPQFESEVKQILRLAMAGNDKEATERMKQARSLAHQINNAVDNLTKIKEKRGKEAHDESDTVYSHLRSTLISISAIAVLLGLGLGYFIARLITRPLSATVGTLQKVAEFDLSASLDVDTKDEIGQMGRALNSTIESLRAALLDFRGSLEKMADGDLTVSVDDESTKGEVRKMAEALNRTIKQMRIALRDVRESAEGMANSAQELASASEELASGAQEQASSLEETTATLEEITSTVKQNADNAKQASQVATGSRDTAEKGGHVVAEAVSAMAEINESSKSIADIITTIDEIAFQTNLLALNAAVEAARAGEQGRGFAVVATEVRNLAQRSATSAKEIKRLIQDSVRKVENGSGLVNKSGENLQQIVDSVKHVTDIVAEIASASREQSTGIEQVNKAMLQMDQVTQTNSSQTEELSATAQSLASTAEQLQALVARFKVDTGVREASDSMLVRSGNAAAAAARKKSAAPLKSAAANGKIRAATSGSRLKPGGDEAVDANTFIEF